MSFFGISLIYQRKTIKKKKKKSLFFMFKKTFSTSHRKIKETKVFLKMKRVHIASNNGMWYKQQA